MICGMKLRRLRRQHHESLDETKENIDSATPCKRRKLHSDRAAHLLRSGRKVLGLTLSDDKLSDTLVKDLCANTDLTQLQGNLTQIHSPDLTHLCSPGLTSNTYRNFSLNESSHIYSELQFDSRNSSASLDTSQFTLDDTRNITLTPGNRLGNHNNQQFTHSNITTDCSLVSHDNYLFTSSSMAVTNDNNLVSNGKVVRQSNSGRNCSVSSTDCTSGIVSDESSVSRDRFGDVTPQQSPLSDKTFTNWTQPQALPHQPLPPHHARRGQREGKRSRSLTTSTPKVISPKTGKTGSHSNIEQKILHFTENYISRQNLQSLGCDKSHSDHSGSDSTFSDSSLRINGSKVRSGRNDLDLQDNNDFDLGIRRVQSCDIEKSDCQNSLLTQSLKDSQLTRIRRKAFKTLSESKRVNPEGDSQRLNHPSLVGVKGALPLVEVMTFSGVKSQRNGEPEGESQEDVSQMDKDSYLEQPEQLKHRGLVRLCVSVSQGSLTVQVMEAKNLQSKWSDQCSAYIQTSLVPDESQSTQKTTSVVKDTNRPQFNQKLTYDLKPEDEKKRMMVSCWSKSESKNCGEFLGCMSFGIKHMMSKKKSSAKKEGWYYLLSENIGHRKHLEAQTDTQKNTQCAQTTTGMEEELKGLTESTIVIQRGYLGYGFTVKGERPVRVGRVKEGGAAEDADLRNGDLILYINNTDVTMATTEAVAEIIRTSAVQVTLEVKRSKESPLYESILSVNQREVTDDNKTYVSHDGPIYENAVFHNAESSLESVSWQPELSVIQEESRENTLGLIHNSVGGKMSYSKWTPDISDISSVSAPSSWQQSSVSKLYSTSTTIRDFNLGEWSQSTMATNLASLLSDEDVRRQGPFSEEEDASSTEGGSLCLALPRSSSTQSMGSAQTQSSQGRNSTQTWTTITHSSMESSDLSTESETRQSVIQKLLSCEESFARKMHRGIQRFSRPLRHKILTVKQHSTLFQNIEKLVAMSDFNLRQLTERSYSAESSYIDTTDDVIVDAIGVVYKSRAKVMCEAYESYQAGLYKAFSLLAELNRNADFEKFSRRTAAKSRLELADFLERPIKHLTTLLHYTTKVLRYTFPDHEDHRDLRGVVDAMRATCKKIQNSSKLRQSRLDRSMASMTSSMMTSVVSSTASDSLRSVSRSLVSSQGHSVNSLSSVDGELISLQQNLRFAKDVEPFQLAVPSRHVIYSGELSFVINDSETLPLWVVLCSDLILLTTRDSQGHLVVVDDPLYLHEAVHVNFNCANASEFLLVMHNTSIQRAFRLRSPSVELKWAWKNILEHRIKSCSAQSQGDGAAQRYRSNYA